MRLIINPHRVIAPVDPKIFGSFLENLNTCIYGGVYDPASPVANALGFRQDVLEATRAMGVSIVRFPGGCFAPYYHWRDGVGPVADRPQTRYSMPASPDAPYSPSSNAFGTDEFITWCRHVGAEPYLCVNMGSGTPEEARDWVEYCNQPVGSRWADLRAAHGYHAPHNVRYWALGNEISASWEFGYAESPDDYIRRAREYARVMRNADPSIKLVLAGSHFPLYHTQTAWNLKVLDALYEYVDYLSMHHYIGLMARGTVVDRWQELGAEGVHRHLTEFMLDVEHGYRLLREEIKLVQYQKGDHKPIGVALDEYNPWYRSYTSFDERYHLGDALLVAAYFNTMLRNADVATLSNMAQLVNVLPAMVCDSGRAGFFRQSISYVQEMYLANRGGVAIDAWLDSPTVAGTYYPAVPLLDVAATWHADSPYVIINIINRDLDQPYTICPEVLGGQGRLRDGQLLSGKDLTTVNDFAYPTRLAPSPIEFESANACTIPPASLVVLCYQME